MPGMGLAEDPRESYVQSSAAAEGQGEETSTALGQAEKKSESSDSMQESSAASSSGDAHPVNPSDASKRKTSTPGEPSSTGALNSDKTQELLLKF